MTALRKISYSEETKMEAAIHRSLLRSYCVEKFRKETIGKFQLKRKVALNLILNKKIRICFSIQHTEALQLLL